ncbi:MAG: recombinase family protein [Ruminiclostridium sp.]
MKSKVSGFFYGAKSHLNKGFDVTRIKGVKTIVILFTERMVETMKKSTLRVVGYARVSSESQTDNTSIELQVEKITEYCKLYDYELVEIFIDNGKTGSSIEAREEYQRMIEYVSEKGNKVNAVVALKADRVHRKLLNLLVMIENILNPLGIAFKSITENFDTSTSQGMMFLQMIGTFAEFERKTINERTKGGRIKTATDGAYAGGEPAYGYMAVDGALIVDVHRASVVKKVFKLYSDGMSMGEIAEKLNRTKIPTKTGKGKWTKQHISYILGNQTYLGVYSYDGKIEKNGIKNKGQVTAIISKQLWNRVQKRKKTMAVCSFG